VYVNAHGTGPAGNDDYVTIKYVPSTGETLWARYYNGPAYSHDEAHAIAVDNASGVYVTGRSYASVYNALGYDRFFDLCRSVGMQKHDAAKLCHAIHEREMAG